ncbi:hypothetical protein [Methylocystis iwaonis]|uniref:hypothetical protein n=1 Tax=Methylocystis iwaonis TaxID=2885079 RepID=UPI0024906031|nr:hypothetical protein [Methylocystis iwaonis]
MSKLAQQAKDENRKRDARRKIIVGGAILAYMEKDESFARAVRSILGTYVGRPKDKEVIEDLLKELAQPAPAAPAADAAPASPPPPPSSNENATAPTTTAANPYPFLSRI